MRHEKIIWGRICCEKAQQVVRACFWWSPTIGPAVWCLRCVAQVYLRTKCHFLATYKIEWKRVKLTIEIVYLAMKKWPKDNNHFLTNTFYRKVLCLQALLVLVQHCLFSISSSSSPVPVTHGWGQFIRNAQNSAKTALGLILGFLCPLHLIKTSLSLSRRVFNASDSQSYLIFVNFSIRSVKAQQKVRKFAAKKTNKVISHNFTFSVLKSALAWKSTPLPVLAVLTSIS